MTHEDPQRFTTNPRKTTASTIGNLKTTPQNPKSDQISAMILATTKDSREEIRLNFSHNPPNRPTTSIKLEQISAMVHDPPKEVNTVLEAVSNWVRKWNISVPLDTSVPFQVSHYIYIYYLLFHFYFYRSHICKFSYLVTKLKTNLIVKLINCRENENNNNNNNTHKSSMIIHWRYVFTVQCLVEKYLKSRKSNWW